MYYKIDRNLIMHNVYRYSYTIFNRQKEVVLYGYAYKTESSARTAAEKDISDLTQTTIFGELD